MNIEYVKSIQQKYEYGFATLIFASLALSLQLHDKNDHGYLYLLITGWIFLFLSGVVTGIRFRLGIQCEIYNYLMANENEIINQLDKYEVKSSPLVSAEDGSYISYEQLEKSINKKKQYVADYEKRFDKDNCKISFLSHIQITLYLLGLLFLGTFKSLNLYI